MLEDYIRKRLIHNTHHFIAFKVVQSMGEDWKNVFLANIEELLKGSKDPDKKFKNWENHVFHPPEWGGAPDAAERWYNKLKEDLRAKKWKEVSYDLGVLSHYIGDGLHTLHTGQTKEEPKVHKFHEFGTSTSLKKYDDILIWDDAGVWLSTYFWYHPELRPYLIWFLNWYDTSRTDIKVLIFTTPTKKKLPPRIREDPESLHIRIRRIGTDKLSDGRKMKIAEAHIVMLDESDYSGKLFTSDIGFDQFVVYLPDPVYKAYKILRDGYHRLAKKMLSKVLVEKGLIPEELVEEEICIT